MTVLIFKHFSPYLNISPYKQNTTPGEFLIDFYLTLSTYSVELHLKPYICCGHTILGLFHFTFSICLFLVFSSALMRFHRGFQIFSFGRYLPLFARTNEFIHSLFEIYIYAYKPELYSYLSKTCKMELFAENG